VFLDDRIDVIARHLNLTEAVTLKHMAARVHVCPL
jgi:hypothetical protein